MRLYGKKSLGFNRWPSSELAFRQEPNKALKGGAFFVICLVLKPHRLSSRVPFAAHWGEWVHLQGH
jgi:hypothetical protein